MIQSVKVWFSNALFCQIDRYHTCDYCSSFPLYLSTPDQFSTPETMSVEKRTRPMKMAHVCSLLFVACLLCFLSLARVQANITETRQGSGYTGVESAGPFIVSIDQNGSEGLRIEAALDDHNVTDSIETFVEKQALKIRFMWPYSEDDGRFAGLIRIIVSAKSVHSFILAGAGSMTVNQPVRASSINVVNSGSGPVVLTVEQASDFNAALSGTGTIKVGGSTQNANIVVSGAGGINGDALQADSVSVSMFGAGGVVINAQRILSVMMMGSGRVNYRGNPMTNIMRMGTGSINQIP